MQTSAPRRIRLLGAEVDLITPAEVLTRIEALARGARTAVVANHNAHSLYLLRREPALQAYFEGADLVQVDSRPMILWGQLLGLPVSGAHRSTYLDWREAFWERAAERGWRVFYLGGAPGVAETAMRRLRAAWPGLTLAAHHGYFDPRPESAENAAVVEAIRAFDADLVLVGMGMPLQERWILQNRARFPRGVFVSIGAAYDYEAGVQSPAPRWTGRLGVEWLWRLLGQPRRLGFRYLVEPWFLLPAAAGDIAARLRRRGAAAGQVGAGTSPP